jgi:polyribonucleotide nucleotidyltransferase
MLKVIKMLDFGAVVEYLDAQEMVLLHVSELAWERTKMFADVVNIRHFQIKYLGWILKLVRKYLEKHF